MRNHAHSLVAIAILAVASLVSGAVASAGDARGVTHGYETPNPPSGPGEPVVALTFDDGPHPDFTPRILEILRRYGVRATFFQMGSMAERHPDLVRQVVAEGHIVANHTWMHRDLTTLTEEEFAFEVDHTTQVLESISGQRMACVRPPKGRSDATVTQRLAARNLVSVLWTADSRDFEKPGVPPIVTHALAGLQPGAIILLHDAGGNRDQTIAALPTIIESILAAGYRIEPICAPDAHRPEGTLDLVAPDRGGKLRVAGQASDPDTADAIDVHVYRDGVHVVTARADGAGSGTHDYNTLVDAAPGMHQVCTYAINVGPGDVNPQLGCGHAEAAPRRTVLDVVDAVVARLRSLKLQARVTGRAEPVKVGDARRLAWRVNRPD